MDKRSKILFAILTVLIIASVSFAYYRFFITKDFTILESEEN